MNALSSAEVLPRRGARNRVDPGKPYAIVREQEAGDEPAPAAVTTVFLTAAECPLRCAMCDLWKNTLPGPTPARAIPDQIRQALEGQPRQGWLKLYNSGSFFDPQSVPEADYPEIASLCAGFDRVVVENHPRFGARLIPTFAAMLKAQLEIAVGLESVQPGLLRRLNKQMTRSDFDRFARELQSQEIDLRVFLMLRPPWTDETEAVRWTLLSVKHAIAYGARHVSIIPARDGNGWMDEARRRGFFTPPSLRSLEQTLERSLAVVRRLAAATVVTVDLWDWDRLATCPHCSYRRRQRLQAMNLQQSFLPAIECRACPAEDR